MTLHSRSTSADIAQHTYTYDASPWEDPYAKPMGMETRQYHPDHEAPDFGGMDGPFGKMFERFHRWEPTRWQVVCIYMLGALAGCVAAAAVML